LNFRYREFADVRRPASGAVRFWWKADIALTFVLELEHWRGSRWLKFVALLSAVAVTSMMVGFLVQHGSLAVAAISAMPFTSVIYLFFTIGVRAWRRRTDPKG
jgi:hypothetical protein